MLCDTDFFRQTRRSFFLSIYITISLSLWGCTKSTPPPLPPIPVTAFSVEPKTIPANFEYVGVAESSHIVELRARVEGYLEKITYVEGSLVKKDALLFVLDQRPFLAALDSKKGELARQKALLWNAKKIRERMTALYAQNAISQRDMDNAISQELAAEANVLVAEADVETARLNLEFASISAPVTAMSNQAKYREGALIAPGPDSLLTTLYVIDPIWVNFSVSEGDILKARQQVSRHLLQYPEKMHFKIEVVLADQTIFPAEGVIDFLDPALQQDTGTMLARAVLANPRGWLRPGQFVKVIVKGAVHPDAIVVPQTAINQGRHGTFVYVVTPEGTAALRSVELGDWYKDLWIVHAGLKKGDLVIVDGTNKVKNGSAVQIVSIKKGED